MFIRSRSILISVAMWTYNAVIVVVLNVLMWRNKIWDVKEYSPSDITSAGKKTYLSKMPL